MALTIGVLFGITAMVSWGIADIFAAKAVGKTSVFKTYFWIQTIALAIYLVTFLLFFDFPVISLIILGIILLCAFLGISSVMSYYKGLQVGTISIISPIGASYALVTVILGVVFLNQTLTALQAIAIGLVILGAILASFKFHDLIKLKLKNVTAGVRYAIYAMLAWGVMFIFIDILVGKLNWFFPVLAIVAVEIFALLVYSGATKKNISFPKNVAVFVIIAGVLEAIAFLSTGFSISSVHAAVTAPIIAAYPAVTIILARIFFKEILDINQKFGVVSILIGLILLSI